MSYEIVFNADGSVSMPDLPAELFPAVQELGAPLPAAAAASGHDDPPRWWRTRQVAVPLSRTALRQASTDTLWDLHARFVDDRVWRTAPEDGGSDGATLLDVKVALARRSLLACDLCTWQCGVDRWHGGTGICGSGREVGVTRCFLNWSEEQHLTPAISVFLSGCNWRCAYCQYPDNLDARAGRTLVPGRLAGRIEALRREGGTNVHWVGGNPDPHLWAVLMTLRACRAPIPMVWNTNGYASPAALRLLDGVIDTYLIDFRHGSPACAERYGAPGDSVRVIRRNLRALARQDAELIVRHLQLPAHFDCCTAPILDWLASALPDVPVNLMHGQYRPAYRAYRHPEIDRRLTRAERARTVRVARGLGLTLVL
jgi:putative pyruvate formate lyase activating enzyme